MDMKLEVVPIPVRDVDAAKDFYTRQVGFGLDHDVRPSPGMRVVQMTPPGSACSVVIAEGLPLGEPGSIKGVQLVVEDLDAIRGELAGRGVGISEVNIAAIPLAAAGFLNPLIAGAAMAASSAFVVASSIRLRRSGQRTASRARVQSR